MTFAFVILFLHLFITLLIASAGKPLAATEGKSGATTRTARTAPVGQQNSGWG